MTKIEDPKWVVTDQESEQKLVTFLKSKMDEYSLKQLKRCLEENLCTINGITERFAKALVFKGDIVTFKPIKLEPKKDHQIFEKSRILFEDQHLFIYNKPAGITSEGFKTGLFLIHRLDIGTTGVLMFAKTEFILNDMIALFKKYLIKKVYLAIVEGSPKVLSGVVDNYLGKKLSYEGQTIWGSVPKEKGVRAVTEWKVEKLGKSISLIRCYPKTGRTHQIRVHLNEMNLPILGDYHYCRTFKSSFQAKRCLLHAFKVRFPHPKSGAMMEIEAPIPEDFALALKEIL